MKKLTAIILAALGTVAVCACSAVGESEVKMIGTLELRPVINTQQPTVAPASTVPVFTARPSASVPPSTTADLLTRTPAQVRSELIFDPDPIPPAADGEYPVLLGNCYFGPELIESDLNVPETDFRIAELNVTRRTVNVLGDTLAGIYRGSVFDPRFATRRLDCYANSSGRDDYVFQLDPYRERCLYYEDLRPYLPSGESSYESCLAFSERELAMLGADVLGYSMRAESRVFNGRVISYTFKYTRMIGEIETSDVAVICVYSDLTVKSFDLRFLSAVGDEAPPEDFDEEFFAGYAEKKIREMYEEREDLELLDLRIADGAVFTVLGGERKAVIFEADITDKPADGIACACRRPVAVCL